MASGSVFVILLMVHFIAPTVVDTYVNVGDDRKPKPIERHPNSLSR